MEARLSGEIDIVGFREEARSLLAHQVPPDEVHWLAEAQNSEQFAEANPSGSRAAAVPKAASAIVPASFQRLCDVVVMHHDAERFALLYRLLWRLVHEPGLRNNAVDPDMQHAHQMGQAVRRDIHKMKAFMRFYPVQGDDGELMQMGWYEPTHHILESVAPWFAQRAPHARWAIFTPDRSVECDGVQLHFGRGVPRADAPRGEGEQGKLIECYRKVFGDGANPPLPDTVAAASS